MTWYSMRTPEILKARILKPHINNKALAVSLLTGTMGVSSNDVFLYKYITGNLYLLDASVR